MCMISRTRVPDGMKKVTHEKHMYEQSYMCFSEKEREKTKHVYDCSYMHLE